MRVPEELADDPLTPHVEGLSEYFQITRKNFDASGTFRLPRVRIAQGRIRERAVRPRRARLQRRLGEHLPSRLRCEPVRANQRSRHVRYRRSAVATGSSSAASTTRQGPGGTQPGLRYYDEADRDRTKASVIFSVNPVPMASAYVQYSTTRDEFFGDESIPAGREFFGLQKQDIDGFVVGADVSPNDTVSFGVSYGRDEFSALQTSRNANPPPDPTWTDPSRNWSLDNDEVVNTFLTYVDLIGPGPVEGRRAIQLRDERLG